MLATSKMSGFVTHKISTISPYIWSDISSDTYIMMICMENCSHILQISFNYPWDLNLSIIKGNTDFKYWRWQGQASVSKHELNIIPDYT